MKINGVSSGKIINLYNDTKINTVKREETKKSDTITISSAGRSLSSFSVEENAGMSVSDLDKIQKEVSSGTYRRDSRMVADKMISIMKNRGV